MTKYGNKKTLTPDGVFDSKRELIRWNELKLLEKSGTIQDLKRQVKFELIPKIGKNRPTSYIADFTYKDGDELVVEDAKGFKTEIYKIKKKLMMMVHRIEILEV